MCLATRDPCGPLRHTGKHTPFEVLTTFLKDVDVLTRLSQLIAVSFSTVLRSPDLLRRPDFFRHVLRPKCH